MKGNDKSMIGQGKCIQYEMAESECLQTLEILFENNKLKRLTKRGGNIIHKMQCFVYKKRCPWLLGNWILKAQRGERPLIECKTLKSQFGTLIEIEK